MVVQWEKFKMKAELSSSESTDIFLVNQNLQEKFALLQSSLCEEKPNQYLLCWKVCPHAAQSLPSCSHLSVKRNPTSAFYIEKSAHMQHTSLWREIQPVPFFLCWKVCPHAAHISVKRKPTSTFYVEKSSHMQHTSLRREILPVPFMLKSLPTCSTHLFGETQPVSLYI